MAEQIPSLELIPEQRSRVHILVVEDDLSIQKMLKFALEKAGHTISVAGTGQEALDRLRHDSIELVLLDIMLPDLDGFSVCQEIRTFSEVPVLMLTALNHTEDVVRGFNLGADDYIIKPFSLREVQGRIDAVLRRIRWVEARPLTEQIEFHDVQLNDRTQSVKVRGEPVHVSPIEFRLLRYLMQRPDRPVAKAELFEQVWGYKLEGGTNLVEVAIRRLRNKVEDNPSTPKRIVTVHAVGYKFATIASDHS